MDVNWGDGSSETFDYPAGTTTFTLTHPYLDDNPTGTLWDEYPVTITVTDDDGGVGTATATVTVNNMDPEPGEITATIDPVEVGTPVTASASFTDVGTLDTHTALWNWGDGTSVGTITDGTVSDDHPYTAAGVYTVTLTVIDDGGGQDVSIYEFVVVYDPDGGFVTGGGWIDSPEGAYMPDPLLAGKANFGFVSKYKKDERVPTGNTEFQFKAGDLNFHSSSYEWLVVIGKDYARFKGEGTINNEVDDNGEPYKFMLWAGDGDPDTFRIRIWTEDEAGNETTIYDNGYENGMKQPIGGGSIVVHTSEK
ncbi:PKD domain-containing protein [Chloroflexota bacterium]